MQQQAFFAIEKSHTEKIVVDEGRPWPDDNIPKRKSAATLGSSHLPAQRGIAVHVSDVRLQAGIRMVQQSSVAQFIGWPVHLYSFMYPSGLEFSVAAAEQSQLAVWIKAATPDPAAQEVVSARHPEAVDFRSLSLFDVCCVHDLIVGADLCPIAV